MDKNCPDDSSDECEFEEDDTDEVEQKTPADEDEYQNLNRPPDPDDETPFFTQKRVAIGALLLGGAAAVFGISRVFSSPAEVTQEQVEKARAQKGEMAGGESAFITKYGGEIFNMKRLPEMNSKHPSVKGNVYIRIPKNADPQRVLLFLHGNGEQAVKEKGSIEAVVQCAEALNLPMIAPADGWAGSKSEKKNRLPGNWADFNDPNFLATLVHFFEGRTGKTIDDLVVGSFSGGNIAVTKMLRGLEGSKDSEAKDLYERIKRIAFFDSAMGEERDYVARWMDENSDARVFSCFNENAGGLEGWVYDGDKAYKAGSGLLKQSLEAKKIPSSRFQIDQIPKNRAAGHGVPPDKCLAYLRK